MGPDRRAKTARILGHICVVVGAVSLVLAGVLALRDQTEAGFPLLGAGCGAGSNAPSQGASVLRTPPNSRLQLALRPVQATAFRLCPAEALTIEETCLIESK
jgi:hypothetical protein